MGNEFDINRVKQSVSNKLDFTVKTSAADSVSNSGIIELEIEANGMSCRVSTKGRTLVNCTVGLLATGGLSLIGQIGHNMATFNPDWDVERDLVSNKIICTYKK